MRIEIYTDKPGETRYRVVADNNQVVLTPSEGYTREEDCERAVRDHVFGILRAVVRGMLVMHSDGRTTVLGMPRDAQYDRRPRSFLVRADDPYVGQTCVACNVAIAQGQHVALVPLGPGAGSEAQRLCREGRTYNAVATIVHYACATGEEE